MPESSLALVRDHHVSRRHAEIRYAGDVAVVYDLGSANGTLLNGEPLQAPMPLSPGDCVRVGTTEIVFNPLPPDETSEAWLIHQPVPAEPPGPAAVRLPVDGALVLGRAPDCDVVLPDPAVAERHVSISPLYGDYVLTDLDGSTGTTLNGRRIDGPVRLEPGDDLQVGNTHLRFEYRQPALAGESEAGAGEASPAIAALRGIKPFDGLDAEALATLAACCEWLTVEAGAELAGETSSKRPAGLCVVIEGKARILGTVGERQTQPYVVADLGRGDFIGGRALRTGTPYPRRVVADTPLRALYLTHTAYREHLASDPRLRGFVEDVLPEVELRQQIERALLMRPLLPEIVDALLQRMQPASFAAGDVLARRGQPCDRFFAVVDGRARIQVPRGKGEIALGYFGAGECFGEAIAAPDAAYSYTVLAETPVEAYTLTRADFDAVVRSHPTMQGLLASGIELTPPSVLLENVSLFESLPPQLTTRIAAQMRLKTFRAGEVVVEQDQPASAFYVVKSGTLEVSFRTTTGEERSITTLGPEQHFGETALLTGEGRNATVRAAEDCQLWALYKDDFEDALRIGRAFELGAYLRQDLRMRSRPRRLDGVDVVRQTDGDTESFILRSPSGKSYLRLSERGIFVWNLLDGDHTINDLCVAYLARYNRFDLDLIASTVTQLQSLGFIDVPPTDPHKLLPDPHAPLWQRVLTRAYRILSWQKELPHADAWFTALYRRGGSALFTPPALLLFAALTVLGLAAFGYLLFVEMRDTEPGSTAFRGAALAIIPIGLLIITALHEVGHALTCKHYGRRVNGAGIGIAYLFPYAFVGTSDIWMAGKGPRIAVSAAGPLVNLFTGSLCALVALAVPDSTVRSALFILAAMSYLLVLSNLHPFMELDGYYVLVDWLEMPSLRKRAMRFLRRDLWHCLRTRRFNREEGILAVFGIAVFVFTIGMGLGLVLFFRDLFVGGLSPWLPGIGSDLLGWLLSAIVLAIFLVPFAFELELLSPQALTLREQEASS